MKIICVDFNYCNNIYPNPIIYLKPETVIIRNQQPFFYPDFSKEVNCNTAIVIKISKLGKNIKSKFAKTYYSEFGVSLNFLANDVLAEAIENKQPWDLATSFDNSTVISDFIKIDEIDGFENFSIKLFLNGNMDSNFFNSSFKLNVDAIIEEISKYFLLKIGDFIFINTYQKTKPVKIGDSVEVIADDKKIVGIKVK
ncbi:MAG: fumarylacetoacetate hydrolase family protein [Bacteroidetes bacterium]|nr:fumarylacetoacetate hydrolase family protein [Bacteroidota bacterium]